MEPQQPSSPQTHSIVFLHGGGLSGRMWQPVIERLPDFHCLAPDLPEHGQNRHLRPFTLEDAAQRIAGLIRQQVPGGRAHVVGLSLGGAVALTLARIDPEVTGRLIVSGTTATLSKFLASVSEMSLFLLRFYKPETLVRATVKQMRIPAEYEPMFADDLRHSSSEAFNRTLITALRAQRLPETLTSPLLVLVGEYETMPAKQAARRLARTYALASGRLVPGVGHVWALEDPELFAETTRAWVLGSALPERLRPLIE